MDTQRLIRCIRDIGPLAEADLELLLTGSRPAEFKKGANLLPQGRVCRQIWFVDKGYIRAFRATAEKQIELEFYFEGSFVTHLKSLRSAQGSDYSLQAGENLQAWVFDQQTLRDNYEQSPAITSFGRKLMEGLLQEQEEKTLFFKLRTPEQRYLYLLQEHPDWLQRIPLYQLSSYLGMARETLSRIRNRIR
jgi:CRP-like cAMP-binding protein